MDSFRNELIARFAWIAGHADVLGMLADGRFLASAADALADPFRDVEVTKIAAIEARGFVFGSAVALRLEVGFVAIRKLGSIHRGAKVERTTGPDWRGRRNVLRLQRAALTRDDRVLLVDDWAEMGSQALTARLLIEDCGAHYLGLSLLVDQLQLPRGTAALKSGARGVRRRGVRALAATAGGRRRDARPPRRQR